MALPSGTRAFCRGVPGIHRGCCERSISAVLNDNAVVLADTIVQKVLAPLLTPVISLVLFFVAFALLRMLVSLLVHSSWGW